MDNKQIARLINAFKESRRGWIDMLVENPDADNAPKHIVSINAKIELLRTLWNFNAEGEMP